MRGGKGDHSDWPTEIKGKHLLLYFPNVINVFWSFMPNTFVKISDIFICKHREITLLVSRCSLIYCVLHFSSFMVKLKISFQKINLMHSLTQCPVERHGGTENTGEHIHLVFLSWAPMAELYYRLCQCSPALGGATCHIASLGENQSSAYSFYEIHVALTQL